MRLAESTSNPTFPPPLTLIGANAAGSQIEDRSLMVNVWTTGSPVVSSRLPSFASLEPLDRETFRITTKVPDAILPARLALVYVVPQKYAEQAGSAFGDKPIGTGPFRVTDYQRNQLIAYEAVEQS